MRLDVYFHFVPDPRLHQILQNTETLMDEATRARDAATANTAELAEIKDAVATTVAFIQTQKATLEQAIADLQAQVAAGAGDKAALTDIADALTASKDGFDQAEADLAAATSPPTI